MGVYRSATEVLKALADRLPLAESAGALGVDDPFRDALAVEGRQGVAEEMGRELTAVSRSERRRVAWQAAAIAADRSSHQLEVLQQKRALLAGRLMVDRALTRNTWTPARSMRGGGQQAGGLVKGSVDAVDAADEADRRAPGLNPAHSPLESV
jgi:hypothetical protein